ncbi:RDD family protein [Cellvibrio sp. OA-2007]|uniref:RDD family protein n=1 Tax=Cellvibrio sp. OA-2007 TaxID=529823 RepID=UPI0007853CEA|nr:RDD family protein [Cellvibrio sp. OA-2007]
MNDQAPDSSPNPTVPQADNTAALSKRFWAFMLDAVFMMIALIILMQSMGLLDPASSNDMQLAQKELQERVNALSDSQKSLLAISPFIIFFVLHGFLLQQYGQTIGKRMMGIAIVTLDNQKPTFLLLIVQRYLSQWIMGMVPVVGIFLRLADILFIYRADRRCIHDHLAKTKVIDLRIPASQGKPTSIIV